MKSARTIHDVRGSLCWDGLTLTGASQLNKEIGELESLVESKIYREVRTIPGSRIFLLTPTQQDELERELERLREKLERSQKKASKNSTELPAQSTVIVADNKLRSASDSMQDVCEICERPGHDIFSCDLLKDDMPSVIPTNTSELVCEDCEGRGHTAANCPHSLDVF